ncbi:MAG: hypothetical protein WAO76_02800, partial [Georgfuchsia sp.]
LSCPQDAMQKVKPTHQAILTGDIIHNMESTSSIMNLSSERITCQHVCCTRDTRVLRVHIRFPCSELAVSNFPWGIHHVCITWTNGNIHPVAMDRDAGNDSLQVLDPDRRI